MNTSNLTHLNPHQKAWLILASAVKVGAGKWLDAIDKLHLDAIEITKMHGEGNLQNPKLAELCQHINLQLVLRAEQWLAQSRSHHVVTITCEHYPRLLKQLKNPPLILFVLGNVTLLNAPQVAIVGSRNSSFQGRDIAKGFAEQLVNHGVVVTSGLATGIDASAHKGAMIQNAGTIAVMGTGPDKVYPTKNTALHQDIINANGACITEFFPGVTANPWHFPRRNRIIAAMTLGTLVVEAKIKSGTLITANLAADMGREVFAVPGSISHAYSEGCHWLIQQGAKLVTRVDDIFDEIAVQPYAYLGKDNNISEKSEVNNLATDKLLDSVDYDITAIDVIAQRCNMPVQQAMAELLEYELRGLVAAIPGGYVKLRGK
ncbi:DNA-processing protein DprA [Alteromonas australica]|uniref:DNA-processing protein DprA n=1 Tax=Alteromonas australica TaxID=589873 RepID=UPI0035C872BE